MDDLAALPTTATPRLALHEDMRAWLSLHVAGDGPYATERHPGDTDVLVNNISASVVHLFSPTWVAGAVSAR